MKGITPIIAIILLLMITIALAGFAFVFFTSSVESAAQGGEQQLQQQIDIIGENFAVEAIDNNKVLIRNKGATELKNMKFYVLGKEISYVGPAVIKTGYIETFILNDSQLAMIPDGTIKISSLGKSVEQPFDPYAASTAAYWKFDEGDGAIAHDSSGNGNDGKIYGDTRLLMHFDGYANDETNYDNDGTVYGATFTDGINGKAIVSLAAAMSLTESASI